MKKISGWNAYRDSFSQAAYSVVKNRNALVISFCTALLSIDYLGVLFQEGAPLSSYADTVISFVNQRVILFVGVGLVFFALSTYFKGALLFTIESYRGSKKLSMRGCFKKSSRNFLRFLAFEASVIVTLLIVLEILTVPALLTKSDPGLSGNLYLLAAFAFIPISATLALVEIFGSFYLLFSDVSLRSAWELSYALLRKRLPTILTFGLLFIAIYLLFSFLSTVILIFVASYFLSGVSSVICSVVLFYLFQSVFLLFSKTAWITFFNIVAKQDTDQQAMQTEADVIEKDVPELERGREGV